MPALINNAEAGPVPNSLPARRREASAPGLNGENAGKPSRLNPPPHREPFLPQMSPPSSDHTPRCSFFLLYLSATVLPSVISHLPPRSQLVRCILSDALCLSPRFLSTHSCFNLLALVFIVKVTHHPLPLSLRAERRLGIIPRQRSAISKTQGIELELCLHLP